MFFTISYLSGLWLFQILKGNLHFGTLSRAISLTTTIGGTILGSAVAVAVAMVARTEILNDITSDFHLPRRDCIDGDLVLFRTGIDALFGTGDHIRLRLSERFIFRCSTAKHSLNRLCTAFILSFPTVEQIPIFLRTTGVETFLLSKEFH